MAVGVGGIYSRFLSFVADMNAVTLPTPPGLANIDSFKCGGGNDIPSLFH